MLGRTWRTLVHCLWERKMAQLIWRFPRKLKIEPPHDPAIPFLGIYPKELKSRSWREICTPMFTAALFTIAKTWKQPKCPLMDEWMNPMWYIHTMEYYLAFKKKKLLSYMTRRMKLDTMLNEMSQSQKDKWTNTAWFHLYELSKIGKLREAENGICQGLGAGRSAVAIQWV